MITNVSIIEFQPHLPNHRSVWVQCPHCNQISRFEIPEKKIPVHDLEAIKIEDVCGQPFIVFVDQHGVVWGTQDII